MSLKNKIYAIVLLLIVMAVFIGGSGMYAMSKVDDGFATPIRLSENVSNLKDLKSKMQDVLISVREIVLSPQPGGAPEEKERLDQSIGAIDNTFAFLTVGLQSERKWRALQTEWTKHKEIVDRIYSRSLENDREAAFQILMNECSPTRLEESRLIGEVVANEEAESRAAVARVDTDYQRAWWIMAITTLGCIVLGGVLPVLLVTRINRALGRYIDQMRDRAADVSRIAGQLASGSGDLADGATRQASSLEATSSALKEMALMTRKNAENVKNTAGATKKALDLINNGSNTLDGVMNAMGEIDASSDQINEIIKTIKEIAFQTNLLAMNVAVEAARAGEAGKGFTVVAGEVRNLAIRSSGAAKSTTELIQTTVEKLRNGSIQAKELATGFSGIKSESKNVGQLIGDITSASNEQAQGVDQINTAVAQLDKVTQTNAATAEETAAAASDLSDQSSQLNELIINLTALIYGRGNKKKTVKTVMTVEDDRGGVTRTIGRHLRKLDVPVLPAPSSVQTIPF